MKYQIPIFLAGLAGITMIVAQFIPHRPFGTLQDTFQDWFSIIAMFAMFLGIMSLLRVCIIRISRKSPNWFYNFFTILGFAFMAISALIWGIDEGTPFFFGYENLYTPLAATMFSILAFFVASAAFRAFRARTVEASLLLAAAFFVMLGRVPLGEYIWSKMPDITNWIMDYPNTAGQRAIMIGIALGLASTALRIILGIERSYLGGE